MVNTINTENLKSNSQITAYTGTVVGSDTTFNADEFQSELEEILTSSGGSSFTEKEVFAAIVQEELSSNTTALEFFKTKYTEAYNSYGAGKKNAALYATNRAIKATREAGYLTRKEAHTLRAKAMGAAQLDTNNYTLGDGKKTSTDQRYTLDSILNSATNHMNNYYEGTEVALTRKECHEQLRKIKYGDESSNDSTDSDSRNYTYLDSLTYSLSPEELEKLIEKYGSDSENIDNEESDVFLLDNSELTSLFLSNADADLTSCMLDLALLEDDYDFEDEDEQNTKQESEDNSTSQVEDDLSTGSEETGKINNT